jgi:hypothetical protein
MKDGILNWDYLRTKKEIFYWLHFMLFFLSKLNIINSNFVRLPILLMYIVGVFLILIRNFKVKQSNIKLMIMFGFYMLLNLLIVKYTNVYVIYWVATVIFIKELKFTSSEILSLINKTAIVYFILSILMSYTPLKALSTYEVRQLHNRFIPSIFRFLGLNGSPAGPDIFYIIVLFSNIFLNKGRSKYLYSIFSLAIVAWTGSLSPIVSIIGALVILPFTNYKVIKIIYSSVIWLYQFIVIFMYSVGSEGVRHFLNRCSTTRSMIWYHLFINLIQQSTVFQWIFGRADLMEFYHMNQAINNPHNFSLIVLQFGGLIIYSMIIIFTTFKFQKIQDKYIMFIVALLLIYSSTNTFIFTIRGNPIFMYIIVTYLFAIKESKIESKIIRKF